MVKDGIMKAKVFGKDKNDKRDDRSVVQLENRLTVSIPESRIQTNCETICCKMV